MQWWERIRRWFVPDIWRLRGYDTFAGEWYDLPGEFPSESLARWAARRRLRALEREQPARYSGGQEGIQDQVYIVRPDGTQVLYWPEAGKKTPTP